MKKNKNGRKKKTRVCRQALAGSEQLSFLPQLNFNPKVPGKNTKLFYALVLLLSGKEIYHRDFDRETDSYRLAMYICELKKMGWVIFDFWITRRVSKKPRIRRYKCYFIPQHYIDKFFKNGGVV